MNAARHLLLDDGTDRLKFDFDFKCEYDNKATFTCRKCGKHEYRNGEFETIKMGDIFTHITHFPSGSSPGEDNLCTQCVDVNANTSDRNEAKNTNSNTTNNTNTMSTKISNNNNMISPPNSMSVSSPLNSQHQQHHHHQEQVDVSVPITVNNLQSNTSNSNPNPIQINTNTTPITVSVVPTLYGDSNETSINSASVVSTSSNQNPNQTQDSSHSHLTSQPCSVLTESKYTIHMVNSILETSQSSGDSSTTYIISHSQLPEVKQDPSTSLPPPGTGLTTTTTTTTSTTTTTNKKNNKSNSRNSGGSSGATGISNNTTSTNSKECDICKKTFKSNKIAQLHYQRVHEKIGRFCCHICGIRFSYRGSLDSHLASHTTPAFTHNCPTCGQKFKEKSNLTNHMKVHSDNPKKFLCDFCPSGFSKRVNLRYHIKRKHPEHVTDPVVPPMSGLSNNNNNTQSSGTSTSQSQSTAGTNNNNNMSQSYSPLSTTTTKAATSSKDKPQGSFKCEHCGRTFLFKNNLKAHLRTHTRDKKYTCEICEKSFIYKESLKNHMLLHSNELPYLCDICGKKFRDRSNRRKHVKNVHKYMFINGDANPTGVPSTNPPAIKNGDNASAPPRGKAKATSQQPLNPNELTPPKKKRNNKKNTNSVTGSGEEKRPTPKSANAKKRGGNNLSSNSTSSNNSKGNLNPRNNNKSVIVSTASSTGSSLGIDQERKIIMSPSPRNSSSPLEYSHLPVTVHVPASPAGGLHQHYVSTNRNHNVIVKASSASSPPDMTSSVDLYHRSQNVIVYPKSKGGNVNVITDYSQQNSVISHNNILASHQSHSQQQPHLSQPQYYTEESFEARQARPTYMTLPMSNMTSSPPDIKPGMNMVYDFVQHPSQNSNIIKSEGSDHPNQTSSPPHPKSGMTMVYDFAPHPSQSSIIIKSEGSDPGQTMQGSLQYGEQSTEGSETVQYSSSIYSTPASGDPNYHNHIHHSDQHQYWTIASSNETSSSSVPISTNVSPPYSTPSSTNSVPVSYDSPITAASNVLNAPSYAQSDIVDPANSNFFYKDLSQFDFSYL